MSNGENVKWCHIAKGQIAMVENKYVNGKWDVKQHNQRINTKVICRENIQIESIKKNATLLDGGN